MIDFHSHILPGIDDGSRSYNQTNEMLREAKNVGFTKIISTSHYFYGKFEANVEKRKELLEKVQEDNQDIEIILGNEIYINEKIIDFIKENKASSINGTKYILIEFSLNSYTPLSKDQIFYIIDNNFIPIIAHPERYPYIQKYPEYVEELREMGALFQSNYCSILGIYGGKAKKTVKKLLKNKDISFLGSDVHRPKVIYPYIPKAIKKIRKIVSEEYFEELSTINAENVLKNKEI